MRRCLAVVVIIFIFCAGCATKAKPTATPPGAAAPSAAVAPAPAAVAPPAASDSNAPASAAVPAAAPKPAPGPPPLTGMVTRDAVESFNDVWKGLRAQDYEPDAAAVSAIAARVRDVEVFAVVATWCPDTRRDLPRFFKIADKAGLPLSRVQMLAVDRTKKDAGGQTEKWNVTRVPTFIFLRNGREIGRVVERPTTTLEQDIAAIVK
ncbi:MAG: thioredoxin family protein [Bacteroidales bacterium]